MSNEIDNKMVYSQMEKMSSLFSKAATQLEETMRKMSQVATELQNGALQGKAGDVLAQAITTDLNGSLTALSNKMTELSNDIEGAKNNHRDGVSTFATRFK